MDKNLAVTRLLRLAQFLEDEVPAKNFNVSSWYAARGRTKDGEDSTITTVKKNECGTTACACGWAATIPEFVSDGFTLRGNEAGSSIRFIEYYDADEDETYSGFQAAEQFFNISSEDTYHLFAERSYPDDSGTLENVVKRIRRLVADKFDVYLQ